MQDQPDQGARPLAILRAMIDTIDRDMIQMLARRSALVSEVAQYKREHGVAIRDNTREKELLADRRERAQSVGLTPSVIESIYRLILWESRDRQASLRAEVPTDTEPKSVAIIGGHGAMGNILTRIFGELGHHVIVADLDTPTTPEEAAAAADVVLISVPITETVKVIEKLGPLVRKDALMLDITSVKKAPVEAMLRSTKASVIGTHPMFGPSVHSLQGQRVVICPGRGEQWEKWLRQTLHARGMVVRDSDPETHDRIMGIVQVLVHFRTEVMGRTLEKLGVSIQETLSFTSPIYYLELLMTARHFGQDPELYASISMSNPQAETVTKAFLEAADEVKSMITTGNHEGFSQLFNEVTDYFGPFTEEAADQSSYLIDRLVERK